VLLMHFYNITIMLNRGAETRRLTSNSHAQAAVEVIKSLNGKHADIYAYTIMPDHIHLLFGRVEPLDDVDSFAGRVKRRINKAFERKGMHKLRWLDGCTKYTVTLDTLKDARDYILANPVRGLLVKDAKDWPWSGTPSPLPK
jgi:REP element-mobilizing transposase RayT